MYCVLGAPSVLRCVMRCLFISWCVISCVLFPPCTLFFVLHPVLYVFCFRTLFMPFALFLVSVFVFCWCCFFCFLKSVRVLCPVCCGFLLNSIYCFLYMPRDLFFQLCLCPVLIFLCSVHVSYVLSVSSFCRVIICSLLCVLSLL